MKFGIVSPIVTLAPGTHAPWEESAGPHELRSVAVAADRLGYAHLTCSEHVAIPEEVARVRGGRYYDPLSTLGFIAAATERIELLAHVVVLPYHHPLEVAKRYGTLDRLSSGRVILGVGVGSLAEEFDLLGVDFANRGARFEDSLRALRASLGRPNPSYHGTHIHFSGFLVEPCATRRDLPIWIGGRSARSLRRAIELADGWDPFGLNADALAHLLQRARRTDAWERRRRPFDIVLHPSEALRLDSKEDVDQTKRIVETYGALGATRLNLRFRHANLEHYLSCLERFGEEIAPQYG